MFGSNTTITCVKEGVSMSTHHYVDSIHFFSNFLVHINTRVAHSNYLIDVLLF